MRPLLRSEHWPQPFGDIMGGLERIAGEFVKANVSGEQWLR